MRLLVITLLSITLLSCQMSKKRGEPPELPPISVESSNPIEADKILKAEDVRQKTVVTTWLTTYRRGQIWKKTDPKLSCELFMSLVTEDQFILQGLAAIHAVEVCPPTHSQIDFALSKLPKEKAHLREVALRAELAWARKKKDKEHTYSAAMDLSKEISRREEKVSLVQEAKKAARGAEERAKANDRLFDLAPRFLPNPPQDKWMQVASDFRRARQFGSARRFYKKVQDSQASSFGLKYDAIQGIRQTYKIERNKPMHKQLSQQIARMTRDNLKKSPKNKAAQDLYLDSQLQHARAVWTLGLIRETTQTLDQITKTLEGKTSLHEVYWIRGRMMEEQQNFKAATEWFEKALKEPGISTVMKERVSWYLGWNYRKLGDLEKAEETFEDIMDSTESPTAKSKYAYWFADVAFQQKKTALGKEALKDIIEEDPLSYYRILASRKLGEPVKMTWKTDVSNSTRQDLGTLYDSVYFEWLMATEELKVAGEYLNQIFRNLRIEKKDSDENKEFLIRQYARSGNYLHLFARLSELDSTKRHSLFRSSAVFVFPTPFENIVKSASDRTGVPAALIYAIMRQESSFDPEARSPADAFGLMQVLPEVAQKTANKNGLKMSSSEDLFEPEINVPIGSYFIKHLTDFYSGRFIQTVASYNASEEAIAGWIKTRYKGDTLEFIEDVPYEETQGYIKLVMRNFVFYSLILSGKKEFSYPEKVLDLK